MGTRHVPGLEASIVASCLLRDAKQLMERGHLLAAYQLLGLADTLALTRRQASQLDGLFTALHRIVRTQLRRHRLLALTGRAVVLPFRASRSLMPRSIASKS